ncbi:MAG TPA: ABC transporter substrate-binding protein [Actinomycetota bacterium]|nr:ABC transporter substrate-binding protein [Actinomycetota bacterium]
MTFRLRSALVRSLAVALTVGAACSSQSSDEVSVKVAFLQDLSVPDHVDLVSPSFLAFDMVVQRRLEGRGATIDVVQFDTGGDASEAIEIAEQVASDPTFVLAVAAPFWNEPSEVAHILAGAGVPTMSLSPISRSPWVAPTPPSGVASELWRRFVPDRSAEASLLAELADLRSPAGTSRPICLVDDGSRYGRGLAGQVEGEVRGASTSIDGSEPVAAADAIAAARCPVVVWSGFPPGARDLAKAMREAGSALGRPVDLAGDALKTAIPPTSPAGDGPVVGSVACSCVDVSIGLELRSRRFVNAYQSEHGLTPGVFAAEAWDAGRVIADAVASGAADRASMRGAFSALSTYDGVARDYVFDGEGELVGGTARLFVASGTRWLPLPT